MPDDYYIDYKNVLLKDYETDLEQSDLLQSRKILQENLHERFDRLRAQGIATLDDLSSALKTDQKLKAFAQKSGLSEEYLTILRREVNSSQPKPVKLADFPGIPAGAVEKLAQLGVRDTLQLFPLIKTPASRQDLSTRTGIPESTILELTKLTDVVRIRWVGANFARLLVDSDCDTVEKVVQADYAALYRRLIQINEEKGYFKGKFGENDMRYCVVCARIVPQVIVY